METLSAHSNILLVWLPLAALTSAFRRWLSHVFLLFPLLVEPEIVTEERRSVHCGLERAQKAVPYLPP